MKDLETLKKDQEELKAKLVKVVEFINSEEYFNLTPREKSLINQQRTGMEVYLNALTNRLYGMQEFSFDIGSAMMLPLLSTMFSGPSLQSSNTQKTLDDLAETPVKEE